MLEILEIKKSIETLRTQIQEFIQILQTENKTENQEAKFKIIQENVAEIESSLLKVPPALPSNFERIIQWFRSTFEVLTHTDSEHQRKANLTIIQRKLQANLTALKDLLKEFEGR